MTATIEQQELSRLSVSKFYKQHNPITKPCHNRRSKIRKQTPPQSTFVAAKRAAPESVSPPELFQLKHGQSTVLLLSKTDTFWLLVLLEALS